MFDNLQDRLNNAFKRFKGQGRLDESNIQEGLREVRLALLEADVNFKVVKDFIDRIKERALGQDVLGSLTPGQQVVKIVHEELVALLGGSVQELAKGSPLVIMMVGLQGSGKTTTSAKLALHLRRMKMTPYLVPADVYRPAAIDQLTKLGSQLSLPVHPSSADMSPVDIAKAAVDEAVRAGYSAVLIDTAGRLHVDEVLMQELVDIKARVRPQEILFVADAMTGQEAVTIAQAFNDRLDVTGVVLTKMDGDARGGAALSIKHVTGKPLKFVGMGEKLSDLEVFHPDRAASRILGMGDILTLIEKAQESISTEEAEALGKRMQRAEFNLEDFRTQMRRLRKIGSIESIMKLIPGMGQLTKQLGEFKVPEKEMKRVEAMIDSMTAGERRDPAIINQSRRLRIAKGSGVEVQEVNQLLKNFEQMRSMMKRMLSGGKPPPMPQVPGFRPGRAPSQMGQMGLGGLGGLGMPPGMGLPGEGLGGSGAIPMPGGATGPQANPGSKSAKAKKSKRKKRRK